MPFGLGSILGAIDAVATIGGAVQSVFGGGGGGRGAPAARRARARPRGPARATINPGSSGNLGSSITPAAFTPSNVPAIVRGATGQAIRTSTSMVPFFGGGEMSIGRILEDARDSGARGVTSRKIADAAKHCGMDLAADMFGISVEDVCFVVINRRRTRGRGISAADLRRTRSTIGKINTVQRNLVRLCKGGGRDSRGRFS